MEVFRTRGSIHAPNIFYDECEQCNLKYKNDSAHVSQYYVARNMVLCDRCIDKINSVANGRDVDEFWKDSDAMALGFPPYPYNRVFTMKDRTKLQEIYYHMRPRAFSIKSQGGENYKVFIKGRDKTISYESQKETQEEVIEELYNRIFDL